MTFQERIQLAFSEEAARRAAAGEPRLTKTEIWKAAGASSGAATHWFNGSNGADLATCMKIAAKLRVDPYWLYDGSAPKKSHGRKDAASAQTTMREWPFQTIAEDEIRALPPAQLNSLEGAIALAIAQLKLGIKVAPSSAPRPAPSHGGLVDIDAMDDPFPMRIPGTPAPWDGGKTTLQAEREQAQFSAGRILVNVTAGEPPAANDKFEKVPELADVRLAAGHGIENDNELANGMIQFRRSFLRSVGADGGRGRVVYAKGDSMEPVIKDGAALLVVPDEGLTMRDLVVGGIYAINYDGKMIVKALAKDRLTGHWVARSLNSAKYADIPLEGDVSVRILGRVVWAGVRL